MKIFLIAGKSGTGKDEVANIIKEYYERLNQKSVITKFSKYIRLFAKEMIDWDGNEDTKPRKFLQDLGVIARNYKKDIFINRMIDDIEIYKLYYDNVIICDVRLIMELEKFKENFDNVYTIHLISNKENKLNEEEKKHITEIELDNYNNFDYVIENNYDNTLKDKVYVVLKGIEEK